jgi:hypothetical protein
LTLGTHRFQRAGVAADATMPEGLPLASIRHWPNQICTLEAVRTQAGYQQRAKESEAKA